MDEVSKVKFKDLEDKTKEQDSTLKEHERRLTELEKSDTKQGVQLENISKKLDDFLTEFKSSRKVALGYLMTLLGFLITIIGFFIKMTVFK